MLDELREFGVRLAIDDFGTGYSSLSHLKRLPVSYIKIDRSFVSGLGTDAEDERIVAAITELGHGLGLRVIAEGVENRQQRHVARQLGLRPLPGLPAGRAPPAPRHPGLLAPAPVGHPGRQLTRASGPRRHHRGGTARREDLDAGVRRVVGVAEPEHEGVADSGDPRPVGLGQLDLDDEVPASWRRAPGWRRPTGPGR